MTMTLLSSITVGAGGASSIEFTSIPQTGTDLLLVVSLRHSGGAVRITSPIRFNSSTTGFTNKQIYATSTTAGQGSGNRYLISADGSSATSNTFSSAQMYIYNYTAAINKRLTVEGVLENNATEAQLDIYAGVWANTAAITSITIDGDGGTFLQHSTAYLYSITKGSGGATVS